MSDRCLGLSLYNPATGNLTDWGEKLAAEYDGGGVFDGVPSIDEEVFEREGTTVDSLDAAVQEDLCRAEQQRQDADLPEVCPHTTHKGSDYCVFHMDDEHRSEYDITVDDVQRKFLSIVSTVSENDQLNPKIFVNAYFPRLDLEYNIIDSYDNHPIDFRYAVFETLNLNEAVFHERILFNNANILDCNCEGTDFQGGVNFKHAVLHGDPVSFENAEFGRRSTFKFSTFKSGQVKFVSVEFKSDVSFTHSTFEIDTKKAVQRKYRRESTVDINFNRSVFVGDANFSNIEITSRKSDPKNNVGVQIHFRRCRSTGEKIDFSNAKFGAADIESKTDDPITSRGYQNPIIVDEVSFNRCDFGNSDIEFTKSQFGGDFIISDATFTGGEVEFNNIEIEGAFEAESVNFAGGSVFFNGTTISGTAAFESTSFDHNERVVFQKTRFMENLIFDNAQCVADSVTFSNMRVGKRATFNNTEFECKQFKFSNTEIRGPLSAIRLLIRSNTISFDQMCCYDAVSFTYARFAGQTSFASISLLGDTINFSGIDVSEGELTFANLETSKNSTINKIDLSQAMIPDGRFSHTVSANSYYDFTEATIGDITLELSEDQTDESLFEYFRFRETIFDGFDFSDSNYREALKSNSWRLHTTGFDENKPSKTEYAHNRISTRLKNYFRLIREGSNPSFSPDVLETTYRKAKIGADRAGDSEASSKFFQKELAYRRKGHGYHTWRRPTDSDVTGPMPAERIRRSWLWLTNSILWLISGYGERPKRVIISSVAVILSFAVIYDFTWFLLGKTPPQTLGGYSGSIILSAEMFTAIILGGSQVSNYLVRAISYLEGFIGSLFIALFVLTITRAIRR